MAAPRRSRDLTLDELDELEELRAYYAHHRRQGGDAAQQADEKGDDTVIARSR